MIVVNPHCQQYLPSAREGNPAPVRRVGAFWVMLPVAAREKEGVQTRARVFCFIGPLPSSAVVRPRSR